MNLISLCMLVTYIKLWHTVDAAGKQKFHEALVLNKALEKLDDINNAGEKMAHLSYITACPAESKKDIYFNEKFSLGKKSLFLRKAHNKINFSEDIETEVCENEYEPSMLYDQTTLTYETGYELYYEEGSVTTKYDEHFYDDFKSILEVPKNRSVAMSSKVKKIFYLEDGRNLIFYWVSVLSLKFNPSKYQIRASFRNDAINDYRDRSIEKCYNYDLGNILYQSDSAKNVNFFNSKQNEAELFDVLYIPPIIRSQSKFKRSKNAIEPKSLFVQSYGRFGRAHLVPLMFLHSGAAKLAACTFMNTIPIWTSILNGQLKLIDEYLYTMFRMWSPYMKIIFGVSGLSKVKVTKSWKASEDIYEENSNEKTVELLFPKFIYRVAEYGMPGNMSYKVIVIHNDRNASKKDRICRYPSSDWIAINNDDPKIGLSYVCPLVSSVNEKLGIYDELPPYIKSLQLNFMNVVGSGKNTSFTDERENIKNEMKKLFPDRELPASNVIMASFEDDSSSAEPEPEPRPKYRSELESELELKSESKHMPKRQPEPKPSYKFPEDGRFWILQLR